MEDMAFRILEIRTELLIECTKLMKTKHELSIAVDIIKETITDQRRFRPWLSRSGTGTRKRISVHVQYEFFEIKFDKKVKLDYSQIKRTELQ